MAELEQALRDYLRPGERIRWTGRPGQGLRFSVQDLFVIPFALVWTSIFFGVFLANPTDPNAPPLFLLAPIGLIGFYMMFGRLIVDAWVRRRTIYAVTDERALVLRTIFSEQLSTASLGTTVRLRKAGSGRGTIDIGSSSPFFSRGMGVWAPWLGAGEVSFVDIDDVMTVYRMLNRSA
jgi:hypothetical protein